MPLYEIALFNEDGSSGKSMQVECADDDAAIELAGEVDHPFEIKVWDGERLVGAFPSESDLTLGKT